MVVPKQSWIFVTVFQDAYGGNLHSFVKLANNGGDIVFDILLEFCIDIAPQT
jgi:hypothetical protein